MICWRICCKRWIEARKFKCEPLSDVEAVRTPIELKMALPLSLLLLDIDQPRRINAEVFDLNGISTF